MNPDLRAAPRARHATIVLERRLKASPARVFKAWSDPYERRIWDVPDEGWSVTEHEQDVRIGGREHSRFGPDGDPNWMSDGRYLDIVPDRRLISAGIMHDGEERMTATMSTIEILPDGSGSHLILTDQSAFFGQEEEADRREGWAHCLDNLALHLDGAG